MKPAKLIFTLLLVLFTSEITYSMDTNAAKYYPLKVGNYWVYSYLNYPMGPIYRFGLGIIDTLVTNGYKYYKVHNTYFNTDEFIRVDSITGGVRKYVTSGSCPWLINEISRDSLSARFRDSSKYECGCNNGFCWRCTDDSSYVTIFGLSKRKKEFYWTNYFEGGHRRTFARDIGLISDITYGASFQIYVTLLGCIINGTMYGDTSLTGITIISSEIPKKFSLSQNYPNPFNPSTKIRFEISSPSPPSKGEFVDLRIFDVLGREITILVNEQLKPGTYEIQWNAGNYPSGVYYYKLSSGDFTDTKKMVLIK